MKSNVGDMSTDEMHILVQSWELPVQKEDKKYSVNTVVDAYLKGVSDGKDQTNKLLKQQLQANFNKAGDDSTEVVNFLKEKGFTPFSAHLKLCSVYDMNVLITIKDEDFLAKSFTEVYSFTNHLEQKNRTDFYSISFHFINKSAEFNSNLLVSDGYFLKLREFDKTDKA